MLLEKTLVTLIQPDSRQSKLYLFHFEISCRLFKQVELVPDAVERPFGQLGCRQQLPQVVDHVAAGEVEGDDGVVARSERDWLEAVRPEVDDGNRAVDDQAVNLMMSKKEALRFWNRFASQPDQFFAYTILAPISCSYRSHLF